MMMLMVIDPTQRADLRIVGLAHQSAVDDRKPIAGNQPNAADGTGEAVDVVGILAGTHHQL